MKVLITAACGMLGHALVRGAPPRIDLRALTRAELDIADRGDVCAAVAVFQPELIINAAAYTHAHASRFMAQAARSVPGCRLLHVSTKKAGEKAVLAALGERAVVLRTAGVYQYGTSAAADSIAGALWAIAGRPGIRGIVHFSDDGEAAWQGAAARAAGAGA
jgi:dTDP-4-dehydrorhamnose reductase